MRHIPHMCRGYQRTGRSRRGDASGADELGEAVEPGFLSLRRGPVLQQLLRHEKRSCWAGRGVAQRGGSTVLRRVQRGSLLFATVLPGVVVGVVLRVLDVGLGVDVALWVGPHLLSRLRQLPERGSTHHRLNLNCSKNKNCLKDNTHRVIKRRTQTYSS